jgi:gamma-glutamylcyclotransferase (GGCT)/AIG2-like uncharacterized protein YtfP
MELVEDSASTVHGELLHVPADLWSEVLEELDELEAYYGPRDERNMYERRLVTVTAHGPQAPAAAASASDSLSSSESTSIDGESSSSGSGAAAMPVGTSAGPVQVRAWTYVSLLQVEGKTLVPHGHWRRFLAEVGETDAGDDWSHHLNALPQ